MTKEKKNQKTGIIWWSLLITAALVLVSLSRGQAQVYPPPEMGILMQPQTENPLRVEIQFGKPPFEVILKIVEYPCIVSNSVHLSLPLFAYKFLTDARKYCEPAIYLVYEQITLESFVDWLNYRPTEISKWKWSLAEPGDLVQIVVIYEDRLEVIKL